ncbi:MAG: polysaccharide deacetylase family protein [Candidatus Geothermarchaeales archaeon]
MRHRDQIPSRIRHKLSRARGSATSTPTFLLRLDTDTTRDTDSTRPILDLLDDTQIKATFMVATGPDDSPRNILGARTRIIRGRYHKRYGLKTLKQTLKPEQHLETRIEAREILRGGHEIALHGHWHTRWIKEAHKWNPTQAQDRVTRAFTSFTSHFGFQPKGFSAPGFTTTPYVTQALQNHPLLYTSNTRNPRPHRPTLRGHPVRHLEMPANTNNLEERILHGASPNSAKEAVIREAAETLRKEEYLCYYTHPSFDAHLHRDLLPRLINTIQQQEPRTPTMETAARERRTHGEDTPDL